MIDGLLDEVEKQYANLEACRSKPHVLDNHTVTRVSKVYSDQAEDLLLYEEQLSRWKNLNLNSAQRREVDRPCTAGSDDPRANKNNRSCRKPGVAASGTGSE